MHNVNQYDEYEITPDGDTARFEDAEEYTPADIGKINEEVQQVLDVIRDKAMSFHTEDLPEGTTVTAFHADTLWDSDSIAPQPDEVLFSAPAKLFRVTINGLSHADLHHPWIVHWHVGANIVHIHYHHHTFDGNSTPLSNFEYSEKAVAFRTTPWDSDRAESDNTMFFEAAPILTDVPLHDLGKAAFQVFQEVLKMQRPNF